MQSASGRIIFSNTIYGLILRTKSQISTEFQKWWKIEKGLASKLQILGFLIFPESFSWVGHLTAAIHSLPFLEIPKGPFQLLPAPLLGSSSKLGCGRSGMLVNVYQLTLGRGREARFIAFANFSGVNNPTAANFKLPRWDHWLGGWAKCTVCSRELKWADFSTPLWVSMESQCSLLVLLPSPRKLPSSRDSTLFTFFFTFHLPV